MQTHFDVSAAEGIVANKNSFEIYEKISPNGSVITSPFASIYLTVCNYYTSIRRDFLIYFKTIFKVVCNRIAVSGKVKSSDVSLKLKESEEMMNLNI